MPSKKPARGQSPFASISSSTENLRSPLRWVTPILTWGATVHLEDEIHDENDHDKADSTANMDEDLINGQGVNVSDILGDNRSEPTPTMQSKIASMRKMTEELREIPHNAIQQNTQLSVQNAELMEAYQEDRRESIQPEATNMTIIDMAQPERYCSRAKELHNFLDASWSNFHSPAHSFQHGDLDNVKYSASIVRMWKIHPDPAQRLTQMTNPVEWLRDLLRDSDACLEDFEAFSDEMQQMYGDKDQTLSAAMKGVTDFLQGANEPARVCTNRIKESWTAAGWLPQDNKNLY